jgi:hypothetical protein
LRRIPSTANGLDEQDAGAGGVDSYLQVVTSQTTAVLFVLSFLVSALMTGAAFSPKRSIALATSRKGRPWRGELNGSLSDKWLE